MKSIRDLPRWVLWSVLIVAFGGVTYSLPLSMLWPSTPYTEEVGYISTGILLFVVLVSLHKDYLQNKKKAEDFLHKIDLEKMDLVWGRPVSSDQWKWCFRISNLGKKSDQIVPTYWVRVVDDDQDSSPPPGRIYLQQIGDKPRWIVRSDDEAQEMEVRKG